MVRSLLDRSQRVNLLLHIGKTVHQTYLCAEIMSGQYRCLDRFFCAGLCTAKIILSVSCSTCGIVVSSIFCFIIIMVILMPWLLR